MLVTFVTNEFGNKLFINYNRHDLNQLSRCFASLF